MRLSSVTDIIRITAEMVMACVEEPFRQALYRRRFEDCIFHRGVRIDDESKLGRYNVLFSNVNVLNSTIDDHTFVQRNSFINCADIGKFCSIAMNVLIGPGQHPTAFVSSHPAFYSVTQPIVKTFSSSDTFNPFKRTIVGHDVWLGHNSVIMDGIKIGTGAVVAAGAVVTNNIPDYAIVAGVPARLIKFRFDERVRNLLLESQWWDWPDEHLKHRCQLFLEPEKFTNTLITDKGKNEKIHSQHND